MRAVKKLNNGKLIPNFGLGTWKLLQKDVDPCLKAAIKTGYKLIAWVYDNEKSIGNTLNSIYKEGSCNRNDLFITSKLWNTFHHPDKIEEACKKSMNDLQTDYLDLYLVHWPIALQNMNIFEWNKDTYIPKDSLGKTLHEKVSIHDTWRGMEKLVEKGLVKSIGVANFNSVILNDLISYCKIAPSVNQCELHPYLTQEPLVELCKDKGILFQAYGSMGSGNQEILKDPIILEIAKKYQKTSAQILLRWGLDKGFLIIPKSSNPQRIEENSKIFDFKLEQDEVLKISQLNKNLRMVQPKSFGFDIFS